MEEKCNKGVPALSQLQGPENALETGIKAARSGPVFLDKAREQWQRQSLDPSARGFVKVLEVLKVVAEDIAGQGDALGS